MQRGEKIGSYLEPMTPRLSLWSLHTAFSKNRLDSILNQAQKFKKKLVLNSDS